MVRSPSSASWHVERRRQEDEPATHGGMGRARRWAAHPRGLSSEANADMALGGCYPDLPVSYCSSQVNGSPGPVGESDEMGAETSKRRYSLRDVPVGERVRIWWHGYPLEVVLEQRPPLEEYDERSLAVRYVDQGVRIRVVDKCGGDMRGHVLGRRLGQAMLVDG